MVLEITNDSRPNAVVQLCEHSAANIREVAELTTPDAGGIEHPSEAYRAVAALRLFAERLPLALVQVAMWFCDQVELEAVAIDVGAPAAVDAHVAAHDLHTALVRDAIPLLDDLAQALDRAAGALAYASIRPSTSR